MIRKVSFIDCNDVKKAGRGSRSSIRRSDNGRVFSSCSSSSTAGCSKNGNGNDSSDSDIKEKTIQFSKRVVGGSSQSGSLRPVHHTVSPGSSKICLGWQSVSSSQQSEQSQEYTSAYPGACFWRRFVPRDCNLYWYAGSRQAC